MATRAKFTVMSKTELKEGYQVVLTPVTTDTEENKKFFQYTPSGRIEMGLVSKDTAEWFAPGKSYYVDFTEAE